MAPSTPSSEVPALTPLWKRPIVLALGAILGICAVCMCASIIWVESPTGKASIATRTAEAAAVAAQATRDAPTHTPVPPTSTPVPSNTPEPFPTAVPTLTPEEALRAALEAELGSGNRDVPRLARLEILDGVIFVDWAINDNLTDDLLKAGARLDAANMMRVVAQNAQGIEYSELALSGFFPLVDVSGNVTEERVVQVWYDRAALEGINWGNFLHKNAYEVAKTVRIHPVFEE